MCITEKELFQVTLVSGVSDLSGCQPLRAHLAGLSSCCTEGTW